MAVVGTSCRKNEGKRSSNSDAGSSLIGNWKWTLQTDARAIFGPPYDSLTPQNTGITEFLQINSDSTWIRTDNGATTGQGRIAMKILFTPGGPLNTLDFINSIGQDSLVNHTLSTTGDTLAISNQLFIDKFWVRTYVRQKSIPID